MVSNFATRLGSERKIAHRSPGRIRLKLDTRLTKALDKIFPEFDRWSNNLDAQIAEATSDPWVNKFVPLGFLGLAVFTGISNGAVLAGESAFALGYVAFDLYWKFQQENVVRKIEQGLSKQQQKDMDETSA